jgi:hypothetical protein
MTVGLSDKSREFRDGIAFSVGSEMFANHRNRSDFSFGARRPTLRVNDHEASQRHYQSCRIMILKRA